MSATGGADAPHVTPPYPARLARDFLTHSGHVPLTLLILELLLSSGGYLLEPDPYLLIGAGLLQSAYLARTPGLAPYRVLLGNLLGPLAYTLAEVSLEGFGFFQDWHHQAYWFFALCFATLQWAALRLAALASPLVIAESVVRASVPLAMYALFEVRDSHGAASLAAFFDDRAHIYLATVLGLLGVLLGFADVALRRSTATVQELARRLHEYSRWALGKNVLERALDDEDVLGLRRVERAVLFADLRGFTAWSEPRAPEQVVQLLDDYYRRAEACLGDAQPIKLKYTADEIMAVFADPSAAGRAGVAWLRHLGPWLAGHGLALGAGLHVGPVVEGVLGGSAMKAYDVIGDTVNTAQRLCDAAAGGELLCSESAWQHGLPVGAAPAGMRDIVAKGKRSTLRVYALTATAA